MSEIQLMWLAGLNPVTAGLIFCVGVALGCVVIGQARNVFVTTVGGTILLTCVFALACLALMPDRKTLNEMLDIIRKQETVLRPKIVEPLHSPLILSSP